MDKLDIFQSRFGKMDKFSWWDLERVSADVGTKFTSTKFQYECQTCGVWIALADPQHQEMNIKVEVTWRTLRMITYSIMVHARVLEAYINFSLMYTADHILTLLPIKLFINEYGNPTKLLKLATDKKPFNI